MSVYIAIPSGWSTGPCSLPGTWVWCFHCWEWSTECCILSSNVALCLKILVRRVRASVFFGKMNMFLAVMHAPPVCLSVARLRVLPSTYVTSQPNPKTRKERCESYRSLHATVVSVSFKFKALEILAYGFRRCVHYTVFGLVRTLPGIFPLRHLCFHRPAVGPVGVYVIDIFWFCNCIPQNWQLFQHSSRLQLPTSPI